jgi:hypothetical protein
LRLPELVFPELTLGADWDLVGLPPCRGNKGEERREGGRERRREGEKEGGREGRRERRKEG